VYRRRSYTIPSHSHQTNVDDVERVAESLEMAGYTCAGPDSEEVQRGQAL
jgi:hypothetical protein